MTSEPQAASGHATDATGDRGLDSGPPTVKYMNVDGARLAYVEQGFGDLVVLLHGGTGDYRSWTPHLQAIANCGYRVLAYSMRYFGTERWEDNWPPFSTQLHASDLVSFLRAVSAGPAHLVTWSYSGHTALSVALDHPELVKSLFAFEPSAPTYITDPDARKTVQTSMEAIFGSVARALGQGDGAEATKQFIDAVAAKGEGYFLQQPKNVQDRQLDNSRVLPLMLSAPPRQLSCTQLASLELPVAIAQGGSTAPLFAVIAEAAAGCIPAAKHVVVPGAGHLWPGEDPTGFSATLVEFLRMQRKSG
jgi:pimeloyl-ACP methyl ester carboxylesterase